MNTSKQRLYILHILSALLGIIFLASGLSKAVDIKTFYDTITNYGLQSLSFLAPVIVVFEVALAVALILRIRLKISAMVSCVTIVVFTLLFTYAYIFHSVEDCGCFGSLNIETIPALFFIRNILMLAASITLFFLYPEVTNIEPYKKSAFFFMLLITAYLTGFTYNNPIRHSSGKKSLSEFANRNIMETPLGKYTPLSHDSTYILYFFSYSCPHCLNSLENMKQYTATRFVDNIVLIGTGVKESMDDFHKNFEINFQLIDISKDAMKEAVGTLPVPVSFFIVDDTIRKIWQGTLPVHQNLRKINFLSVPSAN